MKAVKVKYKLNLKEENRRKPTYYHVSCSPSISPLVYRKICTDEYYPSGYFPRVGILGILVHMALFSSLSRRGLGTRIEELWRHRIFQVLDSRTSVLHECRHDVSIYCMRLRMAADEAGFEESLFQTLNVINLEKVSVRMK